MAKKKANAIQPGFHPSVEKVNEFSISEHTILGMMLRLDKISSCKGYRASAELERYNIGFIIHSDKDEFLNETEFLDYVVCKSVLQFLDELNHFVTQVDRKTKFLISQGLVKKNDDYNGWLIGPDDKPSAKYVLQLNIVESMLSEIILGLKKYGDALVGLRSFLERDLLDVKDGVAYFVDSELQLNSKIKAYANMFNITIELAYRRNCNARFLLQKINGLANMLALRRFFYNTINLGDDVIIEIQGEIVTIEESIRAKLAFFDDFQDWLNSLENFRSDALISLGLTSNQEIEPESVIYPPSPRKNRPEILPEGQSKIMPGLVYHYDLNTELLTVENLHETLVNKFEYLESSKTVGNTMCELVSSGLVERFGPKRKYIRLTEKGRALFPPSS